MRNLLLSAMTMMVAAVAPTQAFAQVTEAISPSVDVTLRSDGANADKAFPSYDAIELATQRTDGEITRDFVGLMQFDIPAKDGYKVKSATLRLVTERAKGSINIYAFDAEVTAKDTYTSQKDAVAAARATTALVNLKLAGTNNKAVTDAGASSTLTDWVNTIDLSAYAKEVGTGRMAILLENAAASTTNAVKVYSSDAKDVTNSKETPNFTFAADDLKPVLTVEYEEIGEENIQKLTADFDVTLRSDGANAGKSYPSANALELYTVRGDDGNITKDFVALMQFTLPEASGKKIDKATLTLVTERAKGSINIYGFDAEVSNADTYTSQNVNVAAARATEVLANIRLAGTNSKAVTDAGASATLSDWVNNIDITAYAQQIGSGRLALLLENAANSTTNSVKVYSSDATDVTNTKVEPNFTFAADDLKPVLTIIYSDGATAISSVEVVEANAPQGIYTITGQKVYDMSRPGIYVVNGKKILKK